VAEVAAKVTCRIMGEDYVIRAKAPTEYVLALAAKVDECMRRAVEADPRLSPRQAAVLAALNFAHERQRAVERQSKLISVIESM
jgi:cell division protein ZapA (FtsZ GTPase activity inhibitor)